jgi:hypothetical protein
MASIDSGLPLLREMAEKDGRRALQELDKLLATAMTLVPAHDDRFGDDTYGDI